MRDFACPTGLYGGADAKPNKVSIHRVTGKTDNIDCGSFYNYRAGDWQEHYIQEGAGFGNPYERGPEKVRENVRDGLVSIDRARIVYGVVIDPISLELDIEATRQLRKNCLKREV